MSKTVKRKPDMSDEETIKRKLMFDGDGLGDDRRLNVILKMSAKWVHTDYEDRQACLGMLNKIMAQHSLCEHARRRSQVIKNRYNKQMKQYQDFHYEVGARIQDVTFSINGSKAILDQLLEVKHNKMMYDMLAKEIHTFPSREDTANDVELLRADIEKLQHERSALDKQIATHKKQFHVIVTSANEIRNVLEGAKTGK